MNMRSGSWSIQTECMPPAPTVWSQDIGAKFRFKHCSSTDLYSVHTAGLLQVLSRAISVWYRRKSSVSLLPSKGCCYISRMLLAHPSLNACAAQRPRGRYIAASLCLVAVCRQLPSETRHVCIQHHSSLKPTPPHHMQMCATHHVELAASGGKSDCTHLTALSANTHSAVPQSCRHCGQCMTLAHSRHLCLTLSTISRSSNLRHNEAHLKEHGSKAPLLDHEFTTSEATPGA